MKQIYSKKVMQHFFHPHNLGKIKNADGIGKIGNPLCGDVLVLYIKVGKKKVRDKKSNGKNKGEKNKEQEYIKDIKFQTLGCAAAIATSSMITDLAKGKTFSEAIKITRDDVADALQGLPAIKLHCSNMAAEALHKAIQNYKKRR